jgi:hypothetical protein
LADAGGLMSADFLTLDNFGRTCGQIADRQIEARQNMEVVAPNLAFGRA